MHSENRNRFRSLQFLIQTAKRTITVVAETMEPGLVHQLCCPLPQALAEPGVPMEAIDDRRRLGSRPGR
jgi:hypothetical protein